MRTVISSELTMPDLELDVSGFLLASMELGIKSVSWKMVKIELSKDREFQDLADWILAGCLGSAESLTDYIKQFRRFRHLLRVMDQVPMLGERTVIPKELRCWTHCTQRIRGSSEWG